MVVRVRCDSKLYLLYDAGKNTTQHKVYNALADQRSLIQEKNVRSIELSEKILRSSIAILLRRRH